MTDSELIHAPACTSLEELKSINYKLADSSFYDQVIGFVKSIGGYNAGDSSGVF